MWIQYSTTGRPNGAEARNVQDIAKRTGVRLSGSACTFRAHGSPIRVLRFALAMRRAR